MEQKPSPFRADWERNDNFSLALVKEWLESTGFALPASGMCLSDPATWRLISGHTVSENVG
jgi:hypothetical protein